MDDDFDWDEAKSEWNRAHRGFGFEIVRTFDWSASVTRVSSRGDELRFFTSGVHHEIGPVAIVWTPRLGKTRIISVRRAHLKELRKHGIYQA